MKSTWRRHAAAPISAASDMGDLFEILLLGLVAMFFPVLLAVVLIALRAGRPQLLLASFLAGGLLSAISCRSRYRLLAPGCVGRLDLQLLA